MSDQPPDAANVEKWVSQYIAIRDKIKAMDDAHAKAKEEPIAIQNILTGMLQRFMDTSNCESIKTAAGTCYSSTRHTASVADAKAFMQYVIDNSAWELLDKRANPTAVRAFVEAEGALPPGVNLSAIATVGVRRA